MAPRLAAMAVWLAVVAVASAIKDTDSRGSALVSEGDLPRPANCLSRIRLRGGTVYTLRSQSPRPFEVVFHGNSLVDIVQFLEDLASPQRRELGGTAAGMATTGVKAEMGTADNRMEEPRQPATVTFKSTEEELRALSMRQTGDDLFMMHPLAVMASRLNEIDPLLKLRAHALRELHEVMERQRTEGWMEVPSHPEAEAEARPRAEQILQLEGQANAGFAEGLARSQARGVNVALYRWTLFLSYLRSLLVGAAIGLLCSLLCVCISNAWECDPREEQMIVSAPDEKTPLLVSDKVNVMEAAADEHGTKWYSPPVVTTED